MSKEGIKEKKGEKDMIESVDDFWEFFHRLFPIQQRFLSIVFDSIKEDNSEDKLHTVNLSDLLDEEEKKQKTFFNVADEISKLIRNPFFFKTETGWICLNWLSYTSYEHSKNRIVVGTFFVPEGICLKSKDCGRDGSLISCS